MKWLLTLKTSTGRLAHWALQLQAYNLHIRYAPGRTNRVADFLSRLPCDTHMHDCQICSVQLDLPTKTEKDLRELQENYPEVQTVISALEDAANEESNQKWINRGYFLHKGVLYRYTDDQEDDDARLVVPASEIPKILHEYHDSPTAGHYGVDKTTFQIARRYHWNRMRQDIAKHIGSCLKCQRYKISNRKPSGLMQTHVVNQRFEVLAIDLFVPLPTSTNGEKWIFIVDYTASRWVELFPIAEATTATCIKLLLDEVFLRYGLPRRLISDNGVEFISAVMQQLTFCLGIQQSFIPLYHAETNMVERKNRDLKAQLGMLVGNDHAAWPEYEAECRILNLWTRITNPSRCHLNAVVRKENFVAEITPKLHQLASTLRLAREVSEIKQDQNQAIYNAHRRPHLSYKNGDHVWIDTHFLSNAAKGFASKLAPRRDGPYVIIRN